MTKKSLLLTIYLSILSGLLVTAFYTKVSSADWGYENPERTENSENKDNTEHKETKPIFNKAQINKENLENSKKSNPNQNSKTYPKSQNINNKLKSPASKKSPEAQIKTTTNKQMNSKNQKLIEEASQELDKVGSSSEVLSPVDRQKQTTNYFSKRKQAGFSSNNLKELENSKKANTNKFVNMGDPKEQATRCWLQLFQAISQSPLDFAQQKSYEAYMLGKGRLGGKNEQELLAILKFWPKMLTDLRDKPELEQHYADLFKALLRLHEHSCKDKTDIEGSSFTCDADLISNLLGLERIAVQDDPPFTEDAVNSYADMAVFIYEQKNAGRTIEGSDNRSIFAKVVSEKYRLAPTEADKRAMASFDLAWAKFKIIWFSSNETTQKILLDKLVKVGANSSLTAAKDPLLDLVLSNWPWKTSP